MKKVTNYQISKESFETMREGKRFNPALEIRFRDRSGEHVQTLSAGYDDDRHVYREAGETYVLCLNTRLGYVGLQVFEGSDVAGEIFLQDGQVAETIGHLDYAPYTIIRRLREYVNP